MTVPTVPVPVVVLWCTTCDLPEHLWPVADPLHLPGSGQCPDCRRADINEDTKYKRRGT